MSPHNGPNGDYAYLDHNDEIALDLTAANNDLDGDGVVDHGTTNVSDVFVIEYTGDQNASVWITDTADAVTFYTESGPIESEQQNVTLQSNESVAIGLSVDATDREAVECLRNFQINAKVAEPDDGGA